MLRVISIYRGCYMTMDSVNLNKLCMRCDICDVSMVGIVPYNAHIAGRTHKRKAERANNYRAMSTTTTTTTTFHDTKDPYYCKICNVATSGPAPYQQHLESAKHIKKALVSEIPEPSAAKRAFTEQTITVVQSTSGANDSSQYFVKHLENVTVVEQHEKIADVLARIGYISIPK